MIPARAPEANVLEGGVPVDAVPIKLAFTMSGVGTSRARVLTGPKARRLCVWHAKT